jgi:hypothetical protein
VIRLIAALLVLTAILAPSVAAHGDGGARGYRSAVTSVDPAPPGLSVQVVDLDDRLMLRNESGMEVVVQGYAGEPYLRFDEQGVVWRNELSPATYLNDDRYGEVTVPAEADPEAPPRWAEVAKHGTFEWHDHRIHWMSRTDPPAVRDEPDVAGHVFDWEVPGSLDGRKLVIAGTLDYEPPPGGGRPRLLFLLAPLVPLAIAGAYVRRRRHQRGAARSG